MNNKEIIEDIKDGTKKWKRIGNLDIPIFFLYYYYPKACEDIEEFQQWAREFVWDFKDGENTEDAVEQVTTVLKHFFKKETLSELTFLCIPASTELKNQIRYEDFSSEVSEECDMWDGYDHVQLLYDSKAKHLGGEKDYDNLSFDKEWFKGKRIVLFDDVVTSGGSIYNIKKKLKNIGATVVGAITLGRTVYDDHGEDPYDAMDHTAKTIEVHYEPLNVVTSNKKKVSDSAKESTRLYRLYKNVAIVASQRGLASSTIYGHLFDTGTLDPHNYITQEEYEKACAIYDGDFEKPALEIDKILNIAGKAAFYWIRRNNYENKSSQEKNTNNKTIIEEIPRIFSTDLFESKESKETKNTRKEDTREASVRLFNIYNDVKIVAQHRGLKEATIYKHLFINGVLDPNNYITETEYNKALKIYNEVDSENRYIELDKLLDISAKTAFYFLKQKNSSQNI